MTNLEGKKAPDFKLIDQNSTVHELSDYKGSYTIIYFYPKDSTPGCTIEAQNFRDAIDQFQKLGVNVIGVSKDSLKSHVKFAEKQNLNFPILVDEDQKVVKAYGVLKEKSMFGKKYMGVMRESFLIGPDLKVIKHYKNVKAKSHVDEILSDVREII